MSQARQKRLREAKSWYVAQNFTEDSHIIKAYRKRFNVDKNCAMKELCMLKVLSPKKQAAYEAQLKSKATKRKRRREQKKVQEEVYNLEQDDNFYYIAGYTSGGAPYGITWEEARRDGLVEADDFDI